MKKRFIIHIGPHKTGSTYIQRTLFDNKSQLKEVGIEYSEVVKEAHIAHHELAEKLYTKQYNMADKIITDMKASDRDILISSENFDRLDIEDVEFLAQLIKEYQVEIIFFKRRLDDLLISSWQELIKHGGIESWSKYSFKHLIKPFASEVLNNARIVALYVDVFGKEKIKIIDFDKAKESGDDICDFLFEAINVPELKGLGSGAKINSSMLYSHIEIIRVLNILYREKNMKSPHHHLRGRFLAFKKDNKNDELIAKLKEIIENNLESLNLNNTFIFNLLNKNFNEKYKELIINNKSDNDALVEKAYELPNEIWYMQSEIMETIESLYLKIERS